MLKRLPYLIFFLAVPWIVSAQVKGAVIVSHDNPVKDAGGNLIVRLHLLNQSDKDITAFDIAVTETYENGQVNTHWPGREMLGMWLVLTDPLDPDHEWFAEHPPEHATWNARTALDFDVGVSPELKTFEAVLDTVIYADKTAETTNTDALKRLLNDRRTYAAGLEAGSRTIRDALSDPNDAAPHKTARKKLQDGEVALDLENAPTVAQHWGKPLRDYLNDLAADKSHRAQLMREHANVTVEGAK